MMTSSLLYLHIHFLYTFMSREDQLFFPSRHIMMYARIHNFQTFKLHANEDIQIENIDFFLNGVTFQKIKGVTGKEVLFFSSN